VSLVRLVRELFYLYASDLSIYGCRRVNPTASNEIRADNKYKYAESTKYRPISSGAAI